MSEEIEILLPKLGESILSATVVQWFKKEGDPIQLDEPLLEVSTDKVNSEIPSPVSGVLKEICAQAQQEMHVGERIAIITTAQAAISIPKEQSKQSPQESKQTEEMKGFFSPAILRLAKENGISLSQLSTMKGTGMGGRVTRHDVEASIAKQKQTSPPCAPSSSKNSVECVKMTGMRKAIADNMVRSFYEAPHASLITEVDVTAILKRIQQEKDAFFKTHGCKLTITAFVARAIAKAVHTYPLLNSSLENETILVKHFVNLGIAVSVDEGLMVPVIKQLQHLKLEEIAQAIGTLSAKARAKQLLPDEVKEGTITLTNFGISGVQIGIPIIRYPEVGIIGMGAIHKKVVPLEDDLLAVRSMVHISLTFDHRVLDGMYGCGFLKALKHHLENDC